MVSCKYTRIKGFLLVGGCNREGFCLFKKPISKAKALAELITENYYALTNLHLILDRGIANILVAPHYLFSIYDLQNEVSPR